MHSQWPLWTQRSKSRWEGWGWGGAGGASVCFECTGSWIQSAAQKRWYQDVKVWGTKQRKMLLSVRLVIFSSQRVADKHTEYHPLQLKDIISLESALIWPPYFDKTPWAKTTWIGEGYTTRSQSIIDQGRNRNSSKNHGGILLTG